MYSADIYPGMLFGRSDYREKSDTPAIFVGRSDGCFLFLHFVCDLYDCKSVFSGADYQIRQYIFTMLRFRNVRRDDQRIAEILSTIAIELCKIKKITFSL